MRERWKRLIGFARGINRPRSDRDVPGAVQALDGPKGSIPVGAQTLFEQGLALHRTGELQPARDAFERVLELQPGHAGALHLLGVISYQTARPLQALELIRRAIESDPAIADAHSNLGLVLYDLKRYDEALAHFDRALALEPAHAAAYCNRGNVLRASKRFGEALDSYDRALALNPEIEQAHYGRGLALHELERYGEALDSFDDALGLNPRHAEAYASRGLVLHALDRLDEALASHDRAIELKPAYAPAYINRGNALRRLNRVAEALDSYDRALELVPHMAAACYNRGLALQELGRLDEALDSYGRALELAPGYAEAYNNRGLALQALNRAGEALDSYDRALALEPGFAHAWSNRGNTLKELGRLEEALDSHGRALELEPDRAEVHWNLALCRLLMGDYERGWQGHEWRWQCKEVVSALGGKRGFAQPLWLGAEPLEGRTILLHSEGGLGDAIQFGRYAKLVSDLGAHVILEVPGPLRALLKNLAGVDQLVVKGDALPAFDFHCPLMSLPLAFKTELGNIPSADRYIESDPGSVADWEARLGKRTGPRIGLAWSSNARNKSASKRSLGLGELAKHLPRQYRYFSLQKEIHAEDRAVLESHPNISHFGADFEATAALCELMDLVISVDTSIAHLAGAMGKPVWILLPRAPEWRWLLDREDSPWYRSARLFRQETADDWNGVLDRMQTALLGLFGDAPVRP